MHLRLDAALDVTRAYAQHLSECPELGPECKLGPVDPIQHRTTLWLSSLRLLGEYGLAPNIALQAMLPLRLVDTRTQYADVNGNLLGPEVASIHHRNETLYGFGDPQVMVHAAHFFSGTAVGVRAGLSLPLGVTQPNPFRLGEEGLPHEHIQFGTGTIDPVMGADVSRTFRDITFGAFVFSQVPLLRNLHGFQQGATVNGGVSASSTFFKGSGIVYRLSAIALHEWPERWSGVVPEEDGNQGRSDLFVSPGVTIPFAVDWSVSLDVRVRVWSQIVNAQLELPVVVQLSIGKLFHLEPDEEEAHEAPIVGNVEDWVQNGEARELSGVPGKFVVYDFWAPWCDACRRVDEELRQFAASNPGVVIRRVNIVDFDSAIARAELPGVDVLPHVRVIDPNGNVVVDQSGPADQVVQAVKQAVP